LSPSGLFVGVNAVGLVEAISVFRAVETGLPVVWVEFITKGPESDGNASAQVLGHATDLGAFVNSYSGSHSYADSSYAD
jgi:hypothetical protein